MVDPDEAGEGEISFKEALVQLVRRKDSLWKNSARNRSDAAAAWKEIGDVLGIDAKQCESKWKYIRRMYRRKKKAYDAAGVDQAHKPTWDLWNSVQFLAEETQSTSDEGSNNEPTSSKKISSPKRSKKSPTKSPKSKAKVKSKLKSPKKPHKEKKKSKTSRSSSSPAKKRLKAVVERKYQNAFRNITSSASAENEAFIFGLYVAQKMENLDPSLRADVEMEIQTILHERTKDSEQIVAQREADADALENLEELNDDNADSET